MRRLKRKFIEKYWKRKKNFFFFASLTNADDATSCFYNILKLCERLSCRLFTVNLHLLKKKKKSWYKLGHILQRSQSWNRFGSGPTFSSSSFSEEQSFLLACIMCGSSVLMEGRSFTVTLIHSDVHSGLKVLSALPRTDCSSQGQGCVLGINGL